jgi:hypothetical protein
MRIVIDIDQSAASALAPADAAEEPARTVEAGDTGLSSGISAGAAALAEPSPGNAPPELLARAASLNALNAGPAPDLPTPSVPLADEFEAKACGLEAAYAGGFTNAGAARLS